MWLGVDSIGIATHVEIKREPHGSCDYKLSNCTKATQIAQGVSEPEPENSLCPQFCLIK